MLLFIKYELTIPWLFTTKFTWINRFNKWWITGQIKKECKGDQELIAKAVPNFDIGCKRVRVVTGFYNTFSDNPSKSHLVTTNLPVKKIPCRPKVEVTKEQPPKQTLSSHQITPKKNGNGTRYNAKIPRVGPAPF